MCVRNFSKIALTRRNGCVLKEFWDKEKGAEAQFHARVLLCGCLVIIKVPPLLKGQRFPRTCYTCREPTNSSESHQHQLQSWCSPMSNFRGCLLEMPAVIALLSTYKNGQFPVQFCKLSFYLVCSHILATKHSMTYTCSLPKYLLSIDV